MRRYQQMKPDRGGPRWLAASDVGLFFTALPLARRVQRVRVAPLGVVVQETARSNGRVREPERARLAAARACGRYARWFGGLNTCLTRSLVAGALLCGRHEVVLHVGFRPGSDEVTADGHAWLTVGGLELDAALPGESVVPYTEVVVIPFERG